MHYRPPDDPPTGSCRTRWNRPWKVTHGIVRTGRARGARRSRSPPPRTLMSVRIPSMHGKAANRRKPVRRRLARVFAGWRTGLPGPVIVLLGGNGGNLFGNGLVSPFEILFLDPARGFPKGT